MRGSITTAGQVLEYNLDAGQATVAWLDDVVGDTATLRVELSGSTATYRA